MNTKSRDLIAYKKTFFNSTRNQPSITKRIQLSDQGLTITTNELYKITANNVDLLENEVSVLENILSKGCGFSGINKDPMTIKFSELETHLFRSKQRLSNSNVILKFNNELYFADFSKKIINKIPQTAPHYKALLDSAFGSGYNIADADQIKKINELTSRNHQYISQELQKRAQSNLLFNAILLSHYAKHYKDTKKSNKYNAIIARIIHKKPLNSVSVNYLSLSKVRDFMWYLNGYRLSGVFSKLTTIQLIELAKQWSWIDNLNNISVFGNNFHMDTQAFTHVTKVLNACSIGFYGITFSIQMLTILKHLMGTEVERSVGPWEQIKHEIWKRHWRLGNDGVWAVINLLTNYADYFHLTATFANQLTAGFVLLDLVWLYRLYLSTMSPLNEQENIYNALFKDETDLDEKAFITAQQESLQLLRERISFSFGVYSSAAALYISGFCLALAFQSLPIVTAGFFLCTFAMSLNLSEKAISQFKFAVEHEAMDAGLNMTCALLENTFVPIFFMTAYSINLPVSVALTAFYIWYKIPPSDFKPEDPVLEKLKDNNGVDDVEAASYFISGP